VGFWNLVFGWEQNCPIPISKTCLSCPIDLKLGRIKDCYMDFQKIIYMTSHVMCFLLTSTLLAESGGFSIFSKWRHSVNWHNSNNIFVNKTNKTLKQIHWTCWNKNNFVTYRNNKTKRVTKNHWVRLTKMDLGTRLQ